MTAAPILDHLAALADPTRARVMHVVEGQELTVTDICAVLQVPQSTVSRHLRILADDGWVVGRADGTSRRYRVPSLAADRRRLWELVRADVAATPTARHDAARLADILAERRSRSQEFFSSAAVEWDALRTELFGRRLEETVALGLLDDRWTIGDIGCGTGQLTAALAPWVNRVIAVDESRAMLTAARTRLAGLRNVEVRHGDLASLPLRDGELDAAVVLLVLHYALDPAGALTEAARVVRPGGRVLVIDMVPHDRDEYRDRMGHLWTGFAEDTVLDWLDAAGLEAPTWRALPADPAARGPLLFAATGRRPVAGNRPTRKVQTISLLEQP
jgi:ubiquinone/menaquinone biosynthesis C-methylase UbiE